MRTLLLLAVLVLWASVEALPMARSRSKITKAGQLLRHKAGLKAFTCLAKFSHDKSPSQPASFNKWHNGQERTYHSSRGQPLKVVQWHTRRLLEWGLKYVQKPFEAILTDFVKYLGNLDPKIEAKAVTARPKTEEGASNKIKNEYDGDILRLVDGVRGSILFGSIADFEAGICHFYEYVKKHGTKAQTIFCDITREKDRWTNGMSARDDDLGYKDFLINLDCLYGQDANTHYVTEIQFHLCSTIKAKSAAPNVLTSANFPVLKNGHTLYKEWGALSSGDQLTANAKALLRTTSRDLYTHFLKAQQVAACRIADYPFKKEETQHYCDVTLEVCETALELANTNLDAPTE